MWLCVGIGIYALLFTCVCNRVLVFGFISAYEQIAYLGGLPCLISISASVTLQYSIYKSGYRTIQFI